MLTAGLHMKPFVQPVRYYGRCYVFLPLYQLYKHTTHTHTKTHTSHRRTRTYTHTWSYQQGHHTLLDNNQEITLIYTKHHPIRFNITSVPSMPRPFRSMDVKRRQKTSQSYGPRAMNAKRRPIYINFGRRLDVELAMSFRRRK